jgi:hypothetical protein
MRSVTKSLWVQMPKRDMRLLVRRVMRMIGNGKKT